MKSAVKFLPLLILGAVSAVSQVSENNLPTVSNISDSDYIRTIVAGASSRSPASAIRQISASQIVNSSAVGRSFVMTASPGATVFPMVTGDTVVYLNATDFLAAIGGGAASTPTSVTIREIDGSPIIPFTVLEVSDGTLTDMGAGVARLSTGGVGGGSGDMLAANNLSELTNKATARANLQIGNISTWTSSVGLLGTPSPTTYLRGDGWVTLPTSGGDMLAVNNLSELTNKATARTNLQLNTPTGWAITDKLVTVAAPAAGIASIRLDGVSADTFRLDPNTTSTRYSMLLFSKGGSLETQGITLSTTSNGTSSDGKASFQVSTKSGDASQGQFTFILNGGTYIATPAGLSMLTIPTPGTSSTVLHGNASGIPAFGPVSLTADVSGLLPAANLAEGTPALGQVPTYQSDGSVDWASITATSAGSAKWIQYAGASGTFAAESGFEYDPATNTFTVPSISTTDLNVSTLNVNVPINYGDNVRQTFNPGVTTPGINVGSYAGDPSTPSNGDMWYDSTGNLLRTRINGANVSLGAGGGATAWSSIGNAAGNASISLAGFTSAWTSTLDSAGAFVWDIYNSDADSATATGFLQFRHNDGADSDVVYLKMVGDADGSPTNDYVMSQTSFAVGSGVAVTHGGVAVPTISSTSTLTNKDLSDDTNTLPKEYIVPCSDLTTAVTTTGTKAFWPMPYAATLVGIKADVLTAPTGASLIVDVLEGGTSVMTTNKLVIEATETSTGTATTQPTITDASIANGARMTATFTQVGSTFGGAGVVITCYFKY